MRLLTILSIIYCLNVANPLHSAENKVRILLVGKKRDHPPKTHEYMSECRLLAHCLKQSSGVETIVSEGWPTDENMLKDLDAIVLYTARGGNVLLASKARRQALELMKNGIGLTAIHWATGATKNVSNEYQQLLGGVFGIEIGSGLKTTPTMLLQADPKHPVCHGWKDYNLRDEYYLKLRFQEKAHPVMKVKLDNQEHVVGWVYERPESKNGRSFGFVCGHFHDNFGIKNFRQAIVNGILWTAHQKVPKQGAPCAITPAQMKLPPDPRVK